MILLSTTLLLVPGIIALKICYRLIKKEDVTLGNSISDYAVVSFLVLLLVYLLLFFTDRSRTISFNPRDTTMINTIYQAGFVAKYCLSSLAFSVIVGIVYAFCKMNPVVLIREIKKELALEKNEDKDNITKISM